MTYDNLDMIADDRIKIIWPCPDARETKRLAKQIHKYIKEGDEVQRIKKGDSHSLILFTNDLCRVINVLIENEIID